MKNYPTDYPTATLSYQWQRCGQDGTGCIDIAGATGQTYTLTSADQDRTIRIEVTATNSVSSATADSDPTSTVEPVPPTPSGKPKLEIEFEGPKKIRVGQPFRLEMTVSNRAAGTNTAQRAGRSVDPTTAENIEACIRLPKGVMLVKSRGKARVEGRQVCRTRATLAAGRSFTLGLRAQTVRSASGPITFRATASGTNAEGATSTASRSDRIRVTPVRKPKPRPPTG